MWGEGVAWKYDIQSQKKEKKVDNCLEIPEFLLDYTDYKGVVWPSR